MNLVDPASANKLTEISPSGSSSGRKALNKALKNLAKAKSYNSKQIKEIDNARKFMATKQWEFQDEAYLKDEGRPAVVFDYAGKYIRFVSGTETQNRQDIRVVPRNLDTDTLPQTVALGELESGIYNYIVDGCSGDQERSLMFNDVLVGGMGCVEIFTITDNGPDPQIVLRAIDIANMRWDDKFRVTNGEDMHWVARYKKIPMDVAKEKWPAKIMELKLAMQPEDATPEGQPTTVEIASPIMYREENENIVPGDTLGVSEVEVIQYQWYETKKAYLVKDPLTGKEEEYDEPTLRRMERRTELLGMEQLEYAEIKRRVYKQMMIAGKELLEGPDDMEVQEGFSFKFCTGEWDHKEKVYRGLLFRLMDPQKFVNKFFSQITHIIATAAKGGIIAEATAVKDPLQIQRDAARPGGVILVNKGAIKNQQIIERKIAPMPEASFGMMKWCVDALTGVSGINVELLGQSEGDVPGVTMSMRQKQGMAITAHFFDNLTRYRKNEARYVIEAAREYFEDGRLVMIGGPYIGKFVPFFRDHMLKKNEYDLVVDEAIRNPNAKAAAWQGLQPIMPVLIRGGLILPEFVDLIPELPASLGAKIKQKMMQAMQTNPNLFQPQGKRGGGAAQKDPQLMQAEMQMKQQTTQAAIQKSQADVEVLKVRARVELAREAEIKAKAAALDRNSQVKQTVSMGDLQVKAMREQRQELRDQQTHEYQQAHTAERIQSERKKRSLMKRKDGPGNQRTD